MVGTVHEPGTCLCHKVPIVIVVMHVRAHLGVVAVVMDALLPEDQFQLVQVAAADGFIAVVWRNDDVVVCALVFKDGRDGVEQRFDGVVDFRGAGQFLERKRVFCHMFWREERVGIGGDE